MKSLVVILSMALTLQCHVLSQGFTIQHSGGTLSMRSGDTTTVQLHVVANGGFDGTVFLTVKTESTVQVALSREFVSPPFDPVVINLHAGLDTGAFTISISGTNSGLNAQDTIRGQVRAVSGTTFKRISGLHNAHSNEILPGLIGFSSMTNKPNGDIVVHLNSWDYLSIHDSVFERFSMTNVPPDGSENYRISADKNNSVWLTSAFCAGMARHDGQIWRYWSLADIPANSVVRFQRGYEVDSNADVWRIDDTDNGLFHFSDNTWVKHSPSFTIPKWSGREDSSSNWKVGNFRFAIDRRGWKYLLFKSRIVVYDGNTWRYYSPDNTPSMGTNITAPTTDMQGNMWFAQQLNGDFSLLKFNGSTWSSFEPPTSWNIRIHQAANSNYPMITDRYSSLWIGSDSGLVKFDGTNWTNYTKSNSDLDFLSDYLGCDKNNNIWMGSTGTYGGTSLAVFNPDSISGVPLFVSDVGHEPDRASSFSVYPNPATDRLHFDCNNGPLSRIRIYDAMGCIVYDATRIDTSELTINVDNLCAGSYYCLVGDSMQSFFIMR